jgi:hypothetical protein
VVSPDTLKTYRPGFVRDRGLWWEAALPADLPKRRVRFLSRSGDGALASVGKRKQRGKSSKKGKIKEVLTEIRYYF